MSQPDAFTQELPVMQVGGLGKIYARQNRDMKKKLGTAAWRAFWGKKAKPQASVEGSQFWAVRNVSFQVARGEALGIIGLNGSGKTTLLRMLAGQIPVDAGEIVVNGTSAAMIDLHAGFQSSASGYENIFLRAAALGFTRQKTREHLQEIIDFSELGEAIKAPLATYSSGMRMRLAFSVMATVSPDILLIDEVLAVGDFRFRQKCLGKIREMRSRSAFVFVSHSMADVERFCDQVIVMHQGEVHFRGPAKEAIKYYLEEIDAPTTLPASPVQLSLAVQPQLDAQQDVIEHVDHYWSGEDGAPIDHISEGRQLRFVCEVVLKKPVRQLTIGVPIYSSDGTYIVGFASRETYPDGLIHQVGRNRYELLIPPGIFGPGTYHSNVVVRDGVEHLYRKLNPPIVVNRGSRNSYGLLSLPHTWEVAS
ncbi:MAG: hypothetical protein CVT79_10475 [Alphaproteobacteria bacterium HGW-Alphaproteobacteria-18]|nr:MAG: hypothetical protein CVT79_10475 [Alphaproteobacteria bacterium HGW-Alphaproteobacteria-18]